jgi:large subunit ribosomal protein L25
MEEISLQIETREDTGKGPMRRLRRSGRLPGVFYGPKSEALPVSVDAKEFAQHVANLEGSHLIRLQSAAAALQQRIALLREVQTHPVSGDVLHVDLYEVDLTKRLQVTVPLHFVGRAIGVAEGGILQPILREIQVECLPTDIPQFIEVDVSGLNIHDVVHLEDLQMPANVTAIIETNEAVVSVLPPTVEEVKAAEVPVEGEAVAAAPGAPAAEAAKEGGKEPAKP